MERRHYSTYMVFFITAQEKKPHVRGNFIFYAQQDTKKTNP